MTQRLIFRMNSIVSILPFVNLSRKRRSLGLIMAMVFYGKHFDSNIGVLESSSIIPFALQISAVT